MCMHVMQCTDFMKFTDLFICMYTYIQAHTYLRVVMAPPSHMYLHTYTYTHIPAGRDGSSKPYPVQTVSGPQSFAKEVILPHLCLHACMYVCVLVNTVSGSPKR